MRDGPIGTKIVQFSIPLFLTYLIQLLYHTTDTLIVGRFLGTDPQAAAVFVGQNAGAAQWNRLRKGVGVTNGMGVLFTVFISVFCILLAPHLFGLFSKDPEVIAFGASIVRITFPFLFVYVFLQVFGDALRSLSHSFAVMLTVLLNIGLLRVVLMYVLLHVYGTVEALVVIYPITWFTAAVSMAVLYNIKTKQSKKGEDTYETQIA